MQGAIQKHSQGFWHNTSIHGLYVENAAHIVLSSRLSS